MDALPDAPTRPNKALRRTRESWRGPSAIVISLLGLAACVCLAAALSLADRWPTELDRYFALDPGDTSVFRVTYAGGSQGLLTANAVHPSAASVSYATLAGDQGRPAQVHSHYTNWQGTGQAYIRDDHYSVSGGQLLLVAQEELIETYLFDPPVPAWSPQLLAATAGTPIEGGTRFGEVNLRYTAWRAPDETVRLPDGKTYPAVRLEVDWRPTAGPPSHSTAWYVAGVGLVEMEEHNSAGEIGQRLELLTSTRLPAAELPLASMVSASTEAFFREDPRRSGAHPKASLEGSRLTVAYRLQTDAAYTASAVFANGLMYVADQSGRVTALALFQSVPRWQFDAGGAIAAAAAVDNGILYFGAADKYLYALDAAQGQYLWRHRINDNIATAPVAAEGVVYFGGEDRTLYALQAGTGVERWRFTAASRLVSAPAVADGRVVIGDGNGVLYAVEAESGELIWRAALDGPVEAAPAIDPDGVVFAVSTGTELAAVDLLSGEILWSAVSRFGYSASPAVGIDHVFVADLGGRVRAYTRSDGRLAWDWQSSTEDPFAASPLLVGNSLLAVDTGGRLYALEASTGLLEAEIVLGGNVTASPYWTGEAVLLTTHSGDILALQAGPGARGLRLTPAWQYALDAGAELSEATVYASPVQMGDEIIVAPRGGVVWALDTSTGASRIITDLHAGVLATPAVRGGMLYLGTEQGAVVALDAAAGTAKWETQIGGLIRFGPAVDDQSVYVHTLAGSQSRVHALDLATGAEAWSVPFTTGYSSPALFENLVIVSGEAIAALDRRTGAQVWRGAPLAAFGTLAVHGDAVYAGGTGREGFVFAALDARTGETRWTRSGAANFIFGRPAYDAASGTVLAPASLGQLWAFAAETGEVRWQFQAESGLESDVVVQNGVAFFTGRSGLLYAVEAASGRLISSFRAGADLETYAAPLVTPNRVYSLHGLTLYALDLEGD